MVIVTDALFRFLACKFPRGLANGPLAMHPLRLNPVEPRAFGRQLAPHETTAAVALHTSVMRRDPGAHFAADRPRGIVPDDEERLFAFVRQAGGQPFEKAGRDRTDGASVHKTSPHSLRVHTPHAVTGERFGLRIMLISGELHQAQRLASSPGVQVRVGQAAPPHFIGESSHPFGVHLDQADQAIPRFFFRVYWGSGLVIQCLARFQLAPSRLMARRIVSSLMSRPVRPCSWQTWAARASVHSPVGWPKVRGD